MKVRSSLYKAKWTHTREEWYKKECEEILFRAKSKLIIDDISVYLAVENEKKILLKINNPKSKWFQIWLKLKDSN
ncbi:MAG: hypothetical protein ABUL41_02160 [Chitinophagaceae bacterium]